MEFTYFGLTDFNPGMVSFPPPPPVEHMIKENGIFMITEDGKFMITEE